MIVEKRLCDARQVVRWHVITYQTKKQYKFSVYILHPVCSLHFVSSLHFIPGLQSTVAHNCLGKTKSHGTTNFTHGKTKLTHGITKKMSWPAVVICIWNDRSCNNNTLLARKPPFFELTMFCTACGSVVDEDANFCKNCGRGTFVNLKCSYLHFF